MRDSIQRLAVAAGAMLGIACVTLADGEPGSAEREVEARIIYDDGEVTTARVREGHDWRTWGPSEAEARFVLVQDEPRPRVLVGVTLTDRVDDDAIRQAGYDPDSATRILTVLPDTPAQRAGLRSGDVIVTIEGADGATADELRAFLRTKDPDDQIALVVLRAGEVIRKSVTLDALREGNNPGHARRLRTRAWQRGHR